MTQDTATPKSQTQPPGVLPWRLVMIPLLVMCAVSMAAVYAFGPVYAAGAGAGVALGFFGTLFSTMRKSALGVLAVVIATAPTIWFPEWVRFAVVIPVMAALAGRELAQDGTRTFVFAIISWILLLGPALNGADGGILVLVFVLSACVGAGLAAAMGAQGKVPPTDVESGYAVAHAIALAIGLALALWIAKLFDTPHTHWIAMLFAVRALDPPGQHLHRATRRGFATVVGAGAAGLLVILPLSAVVFKLVGAAFMLVGIRYLTSGAARSTALMSAGVVLATAPTAETALFRIEAAVIAAALVVGLFLVTGYIRSLFRNRAGPVPDESLSQDRPTIPDHPE
ncbi:FUSC family protein [Sulfitobacter sp. JL08]|uniref:FUSC family protein n=1 Tax=Sulfitobacter sp. JL08 TaxID=2070369 RepID=UPI0013B44E42|nr:FUSC family protein [Sulfitobacter sp. JL08]